MKRSEIQVGHTYRNRGKGKTTRTVLAMGPGWVPHRWYGNPDTEPDDTMGVKYKDNRGCGDQIYLSTFASWAGGEVGDD